MTAFTACYLVMAIISPFVGRLVDRYGVRSVISIGALVGSIGFVLLSQVSELWHFYVGYAVVGGGLSAMGYIPGSAVVSNWFQKRRGLAIGIMSMGLGGGGFAMAPLVGGYLIPRFGWSVAYLALAIIMAVFIIPLALLVIKSKPADLGLYPDGMEASEITTATEISLSAFGGLPLSRALTTSALWLIAVAFLFIGFSQVGILQNQVPHLEDIGFSVTVAAIALGGLGLVSAVGKLFFGWLCDRIPVKYACSIGLGFELVGIITLMNIGPASSLAMVWLYAITMGLGAGSWLPTMSMITSANFGLAAYGTIFGVVALIHSLGTAIGPLIVGYLYDAMNTYHLAFIILLALCAVAIPLILAVRHPKSV